ncbi:MAG: BACON domain-containing protein [Saprospiraceae bacterium]|nr:BACON domain-containing protein [Saprospiraceae bacterium]
MLIISLFKISQYVSKSTNNAKFIRAVDFYGIACSHYYLDNVNYKPSSNQNQYCSITPTSLNYDYSSSDNILTVASNTIWTLDKLPNATWVHLSSPSSSANRVSGNGQINPSEVVHIFVDYNNSTSPRNTYLTFTCSNGVTEIIPINQTETIFCNISPNPSYCNYNASTIYVDATTNSNWTLSIPANIDWVEFVISGKTIGASGGAAIPIKIKENLSSIQRTATLSFLCNGLLSDLIIIQSGKPVSAT